MTKTADYKGIQLPAGGHPATPMTVCSDVISSIVAVYVFVILTIFPLFTTDMYFDILVDRYYFFWISTAAMLSVSAVVALIGIFVELKENNGTVIREFFGQFSPGNRMRRQALKKMFCPADWFFILFLLTALCSTVFSEWQYEAFWGNMGRFQGFFTWIWYAAAYFMVTRFFHMKRWYLDVALLVGVYIAVWGIQDYLGFDPHGWLYEVADEQKSMFTSSIGNINTYTAVIGVYMALSAVLFAGKSTGESRLIAGVFQGSAGGKILSVFSGLRRLFYLICTLVFFTAIITGRSDNAVLAVLVLLAFLPFYAWKTWGGFVRYLLIAAGFFLALLISRNLTLQFPNQYNGFWSGILPGLSEQAWVEKIFALILLLTAAIVAGLFVRSASEKKREQGPGVFAAENNFSGILSANMPAAARLIWLAIGIIAFFVLIWLFWDANHGGHPDWYENYANVFYFNNDWGTHRGHNWSILTRHFTEFPLWKKLIGSGPETYGIVTRINDYQEMIDLYGEVYDSPHNEFLQYLFTTGVLGFVGYYGWIVGGCLQMLGVRRNKSQGRISGTAARQTMEGRHGADRTAMAACAFAVLVYTGQSVINISVPIIVGYVIVLFSAGMASARRAEHE